MNARAARALIDIELPTELDTGERAMIAIHAADLLADRVGRMARPFRYAFFVLMLVFDWGAWPSCGRRFASASPQARRMYCQAVESGPVAPLRHLMKMVRMLSLVAYYDNPRVRGTLGFLPGGVKAAAP